MAKTQQAVLTPVRRGNIRLPARSVILAAEGRIVLIVSTVHSSDNRLRSGRWGCSIQSAQRFMTVVEVEEDFPHVATMAGMASGDVLRRYCTLSALAKMFYKLLDSRKVGKRTMNRWKTGGSV